MKTSGSTKHLGFLTATAVLLCLALAFGACSIDGGPALSSGMAPIADDSSDVSESSDEVTDYLPVDIGNGLIISRISRYAGSFVEDGSDDTVSDVCAITVKNAAEKTVQYARIVLTFGDTVCKFDLTTLPPGSSAQLLELSRTPLPDTGDSPAVTVANYAAFEQEPSMCEDIFEITTQDTAITITNRTEHDITGQIYVYYKIAYGDLYLGGITYRSGVAGLAAGESADCYAGHFSNDYSKLMFVTYVQ